MGLPVRKGARGEEEKGKHSLRALRDPEAALCKRRFIPDPGGSPPPGDDAQSAGLLCLPAPVARILRAPRCQCRGYGANEPRDHGGGHFQLLGGVLLSRQGLSRACREGAGQRRAGLPAAHHQRREDSVHHPLHLLPVCAGKPLDRLFFRDPLGEAPGKAPEPGHRFFPAPLDERARTARLPQALRFQMDPGLRRMESGDEGPRRVPEEVRRGGLADPRGRGTVRRKGGRRRGKTLQSLRRRPQPRDPEEDLRTRFQGDPLRVLALRRERPSIPSSRTCSGTTVRGF